MQKILNFLSVSSNKMNGNLKKEFIILLGGKSNLAQEIKDSFDIYDYELLIFSRKELELLDQRGIKTVFQKYKPSLIINTAAFTNVEKAENDFEQAIAVNATSLIFIAKLCRNMDIPLIHISTDYVFDGKKNSPYMPQDAPSPLNAYGLSKRLGEENIISNMEKYLIIRTSWLFGNRDGNFLTNILEQAQNGKDLFVVDDQLGSPTSINFLSKCILCASREILSNNSFDNWGIYHVSGIPESTWYNFAKNIVDIAFSKKLLKKKLDISPKQTAKDSGLANRPVYSVLDSSKFQKIFKVELESWKAGISKEIDKIVDRNLRKQG